MNSNFFRSLILPVFMLLVGLIACNKDSNLSTEELVDASLYTIQERGGIGQRGCFELVFPISFTLPDGTAVTAEDYDEMKSALQTYFDRVDADKKSIRKAIRTIDFVYPISVINSDGELITVADQDELKALRRECGGDRFGQYGTSGHGQHLKCFSLNFPLTIAFPDGTTADAADKSAIRSLLRDWKQNNPGQQTERPTLVFPISVTMEDGTIVDVASKDELKALKESCE